MNNLPPEQPPLRNPGAFLPRPSNSRSSTYSQAHARLCVLILEDNPDDAELLALELIQFGYEIDWVRVDTEQAFVERLAQPWDIILTDYQLPQFDALAALQYVKQLAAGTPVLVVSGAIGEEQAVAAIHEGAIDYINKEYRGRLGVAVSNALRHRQMQQAQVEAQQRLARSEQQYRSLFEQNPDAVFSLDADGNFTSANARLSIITGYSPEQLHQMSFEPLIAPEDYERTVGHFLRALQGAAQNYDVRGIRQDGNEFYINVTNLPIIIDGEIVGIYGIAKDITQRTRREREQAAIIAIVEALRTAEHYDEIMQAVLATIQDLFTTVAGTYAEIDPQLNELVVQAGVGEGRLWVGHRMPSSDPIVRSLLQEKRPFVKRRGREYLRGKNPNVDADQVPEFAMVGLAVRTQHNVIGTLCVSRSEPFSKHDVSILATVSTLMGAALQKARYAAAMERQIHRLAALHAIDSEISAGTADLPHILAVIVQHVVEQLSVDATTIYLLDESQTTLQCVSRHDPGNSLSSCQRLSLHDSLAGRALLKNELLWDTNTKSPDIKAPNGISASAICTDCEDFAAYAIVPLFAKGKPLGVLEVCHRTPLSMDADWRDYLRILGGQAALAVNNARMMEQTHILLRQTQEQAQQMQEIVDSVPEAVLVLNVRHRIILANRTADTYLPYLGEARLGDVLARVGNYSLADLLTRAQSAGDWDEFTLDTGQIFEYAVRTLARDADEPARLLVLRDVTEEHRRQEVIQSQERLATVGQLAAGIAHDFNNILAVIALYSGSLIKNPDLPKRRQYLETISRQTQHAASLIAQILDFGRRSLMELDELDLRPFLQETVDLLQRMLPENIETHLEMPEAALFVRADPARLQQVLMNLALNARDAMPEGGILWLELGLRAVDYAAANQASLSLTPGNWVTLTVRDSGTGIAAEHRPHIFEPFFTTKAFGKGTGLGLAQVYGIVKQHNGEIDVQTQAGFGTTFTIFLPRLIQDAPVHLSLRQAVDPQIAGNTYVLLVEDNPEALAAIHDLLRDDLGYQVYTATSGAEAVQIFAQHANEISLILCDMVLPETDGASLYSALLSTLPAPGVAAGANSIRMILMSGYPLTDKGRALVEQGVLAWIQKPFTPDDLAVKIRAVLNNSPTATPLVKSS